MREESYLPENEKLSALLTRIVKRALKKKLKKDVRMKCILHTLDLSVKEKADLNLSIDIVIEDDALKELTKDSNVPGILLDFSGLVSNLGIVKRKAGSKICDIIKNKTGASVDVEVVELKKSKKNELDRIAMSVKLSASKEEFERIINTLIKKYGTYEGTEPYDIVLVIKDDKVSFRCKTGFEVMPVTNT